MKTFRVAIQVIETWHITVEAKTEKDAIRQVDTMNVGTIRERGSLDDTTVDYVEVQS